MKKLIIYILSITGALYLLITLGGFAFDHLSKKQYVTRPMILKLHLASDSYNEGEIYTMVRALELAAKDPQVQGVLAQIDNPSIGIAQCQELRNAVIQFRSESAQQEKCTVAFAETFGEMGSGLIPYFLATAFENIILQPYGLLSITGLTAEVPFAKEAMAQSALAPQVTRSAPFKSLMNPLTESEFSPQTREALQHLLNSLLNLMIRDIAVARELTESEVQDAIDHAPLIGPQALKAGLIDACDYIQAAHTAAVSRIDGPAHFITPTDYLTMCQNEEIDIDQPKFALVTLEGEITRAMGKALSDATQDPSVKAIILRVNSRSGNPVACETLWNAIAQAKRRNKPVIVSMSDSAASGAYWAACAATKIVAQPSTITGAIGATAGKLVTDKFWKKLGVNWSVLSEGQNAELWSPVVPYTPEGQNKIDFLLSHLYEGFIYKVVTGRGLPVEHVQHLAHGRPWCGEDALRYGLVDQLGGYREAIELAQIETGLQGQQLPLVLYPRHPSLYDLITPPPEAVDVPARISTAPRPAPPVGDLPPQGAL